MEERVAQLEQRLRVAAGQEQRLSEHEAQLVSEM